MLPTSFGTVSKPALGTQYRGFLPLSLGMREAITSTSPIRVRGVVLA